MVRGYTTIEQSKKLLELGLDPSAADMCYQYWDKNNDIPVSISYTDGVNMIKQTASYDVSYNKKLEALIPCWSLAALIELMPKTIISEGCCCYLFIDVNNISFDYLSGFAQFNSINADTLLDAAVENVKWLIEQGHIKTKTNIFI